jgi:hypothetical protein
MMNDKTFKTIGDPILSYLLRGIFGSTKQSVTAAGIQTGRTGISDILAGGGLNASQFSTIETTKKSFFGLFKSTSFEEVLTPLAAPVKKSLTEVFRAISFTMVEAAKAFGSGTEKAVRAYVLPSVRIDLKGLNAEESSKKMTGVISAMLDDMTTAVFGRIVGQYQKLGEGMLETAIRIVAQMGVVRDAVRLSGQSIEKNAIGISDALISAAGGIQEFQKQFEKYFEGFYSDAEKQAQLRRRLTLELKDSNIVLPKSAASYRLLLEAQRLDVAVGRERYSALLRLAGEARKYYDGLEKIQRGAITAAQKLLGDNISRIGQIIETLTRGTKTILSPLPNLGAEREGAKLFLQGQLGLANSGKALNAAGIEGAVSTLEKPSEKLFGTSLAFKIESARMAALLDSIAKKEVAQQSVWAQQLRTLNTLSAQLDKLQASAKNTELASKKTSELLIRVTRNGNALVTTPA